MKWTNRWSEPIRRGASQGKSGETSGALQLLRLITAAARLNWLGGLSDIAVAPDRFTPSLLSFAAYFTWNKFSLFRILMLTLNTKYLNRVYRAIGVTNCTLQIIKYPFRFTLITMHKYNLEIEIFGCHSCATCFLVMSVHRAYYITLRAVNVSHSDHFI